MRILQVIDSIHPGNGGPVECVNQMTAELRLAGDHVEIEAFAEMGDARGRFGHSPRGAAWLRDNVDRFDAVVVHGIWRHSALAVSRIARSRGIPYFIYPHGALDHALPRLYPLRHVRKRIYWELLGRSILRHAAGVCFTSANEAARATAYPGPFVSLVIGSGIQRPPRRNDEDIVALRERLGIRPDARIVLFMGRVDPIKGLDVLMRGLGRVEAPANVVLLIAGRGTPRYVAQLEELAKAARVPVVWAGMLAGNDKWAAIHAAELVVLPSRQESFGVAAVEALAASTPVLVSDRVGICDVVEKRGAGVVVRLDEASLAAALQDWIGGSLAGASTNALRCYEENFLASTAAARLRARIASAISIRPALATRATYQAR